MEARLKEDILMEAARCFLWFNTALSLFLFLFLCYFVFTFGYSPSEYVCTFDLQIWK
jgi:hypothetical protein